MGLDQVTKEILDNSKKEVDRILNEGREEAEKIMQQARDSIESHKKQVEEDAMKSVDNIEKREISAANFEIKKGKLDKKKEIIDKVFESVRQEMEKLPERKREEYLKKLFEKASKDIEICYVYANEADKDSVKKIKGTDFKKAEIIGGLIAENKELTMKVDYSFEELLKNIKEKSLQELAKILF